MDHPLTARREETDFDRILLTTVDRVLSDVLGEAESSFVFCRLRSKYNLEKRAIPRRIGDFSFGLVDLLGSGGEALLQMITDGVAEELLVKPPRVRGMAFEEKLRSLSESRRKLSP
ncbi:MAG: hypothetical protein JSV18_06425 [Candidatus Bathyarchaeota archaeon]|nr:MAG: hypothetical protein JSV18_06425 [Candidatus Bathyarchaeota archaeon]